MSGASGEAAQPPPNDAEKPKKKPMGPTLPTDVAKNLDDEDFFKLSVSPHLTMLPSSFFRYPSRACSLAALV
jgi:hypothetical protein